MIQFLSPALILLLLAACAPAAPRPIENSPPAESRYPRAAPATLKLLEEAEAQVAATRKWVPNYTESDRTLRDAQRAASRAQNPRAQGLAREARDRAALALDGYYVTASAQELQKLFLVTGLSEKQLDLLREAEVLLVRGEAARAHALLQKINQETSKTRQHRVSAGESLWSISARPEVYANGFLWPLIWDANRDRIKDPSQLQAGQKLRIRPNPTVDEVVRAVEYARQQAGTRVRVGEITQE